MSLRPEFVAEHIGRWEKALTGVFYPYRARWPSRLFHHAPLENAVSIFNSGFLRSRNDPKNPKPKDVAAEEVVNSRTHAHNFVRLYFRPRTPTQFHIEGIRQADECRYGPDAHAPILVMLVFDAKKVLVLDGLRFCDRNMQGGDAEIQESEEQFGQIPFEKVYHEGGIGGDRSIIEHRCAEVLTPTPLSLEQNLEFTYCRSEAEKETLLYQLRDAPWDYSDLIRVSQDLRVFQREYVFVEEVSLSKQGIVFRLNPRQIPRPVDTQVEAWDASGTQKVSFRNSKLPAVPENARNWQLISNSIRRFDGVEQENP
jgi:ssDNA thymidine ADP-ribosyltransferase, DarT